MQFVMNSDHSVEKMDDLVEWARRFELDDRVVQQDSVGRVRVSTVFLGIQHGEDGQGRPLLFETMVFKGPLNGEQARYATYAEAKQGHLALLVRVEAAEGQSSSSSSEPSS